MLCLGDHLHCEVFLPEMKFGNEVGMTFTNFSCHKMELRGDIKQSYDVTPQAYSCFTVLLSEAEYDTFVSQNLTLVQRHVGYNYSDCALAVLPKTLKGIFVQDMPLGVTAPIKNADRLPHVVSLFCAQSLIMTLRVSLAADHELHGIVHNLTARCTKPQELFEAISSVCSETDLTSRVRTV
jgi:hypothetical protein